MMLQYPIRKLVELVDEISNVDTTHRIGLGEWHWLGEVLPGTSASLRVRSFNLHSQLFKLSSRQPADPGYLIKLLLIADHHRLIIVLGYNLIKVGRELS